MKFTVDTDAKLLTIEQELTFQELKAFINTLPVEWAAYKLVIKEPDNTYKWPFYYPPGVREIQSPWTSPSGPIISSPVTVSSTNDNAEFKAGRRIDAGPLKSGSNGSN